MMHWLRASSLLRALLSIGLVVFSLPFPAVPAGGGDASNVDSPSNIATPETPTGGSRASEAAPPAAGTEPPAPLEQAREYIKTGDYDNAIEILRATIDSLTVVIEQARNQVEPLRDAYLLLIKAWVQLGKENESKLQGREQAKLNYDEAKALIAKCLAIKELRHTRPEAGPEYPQKMIELFDEVRDETLGSLRVVELHPPNATVLLDAETLGRFPGDSLLGDVDLPVGPHRVVVHAPRYKDFTEEIVIKPGVIEGRSYRLSRKRSRTWWATVTTGAIGVVGGTIALLVGKGRATTTTPEPLPGPPPPPTQ